MNGKKAKKLRKKANTYIHKYVKERVLTEDLTKDMDYGTIIGVLPYRTYFRKGWTLYNGVFTRRWFYRLMKKNPNLDYNEVIPFGTGS